MKDMLRQMLHEAQEAVKAAQEEQARNQRAGGFPGSGGPVRGMPGEGLPRQPGTEQDVYPERVDIVRDAPRDRFPEQVAGSDVRERRPRRPQLQAVARQDSRQARAAALRRVLSSPGSLQTAFLVREVLGPPVALREEEDPFGS